MLRRLCLPVLFAVAVVAAGLAASMASTAEDAASFADDSNPFAEVDTGGVDAVTIQVLHDGVPGAKILVELGGMLRVGRVDSKEQVIGFVPEEISERGQVRLAAYAVEKHLRADTEREWLHDLTLTVGDPPTRVSEDVAAHAKVASIELKLLGVTLANR